MKHNLGMEVNPGWEDPGLGDPGWEDPQLVNPGLGDPGWEDPRLVDPGLGDPGLVNPGWEDLGIQGWRISCQTCRTIEGFDVCAIHFPLLQGGLILKKV